MENLLLKLNKTQLILISLLITSFGFSQTSQTFTTSGTGTFVVPAGVTSITVETWGAAGGGGNSNNNTANGGSGGGGGAYAKGTHTVTPESTYYFNVGIGGTGGPANSTTAPTAGGNTWFNATAGINAVPATNILGTLAVGGGPGVNNSTAIPSNGGAATACFGNQTTTIGSNGSAGSSNGGGNGGTGANGGTGGAGSTNGDGSNGNPPGGGGGGGNDVAANKGGNGANGQVKITWTCPIYALTSAATATGPFCVTGTSIVTLSSSSLPSGIYTVSYNLTGATTATGSTTVMNFTSGSPGTGTFTTSPLNIGITNITITNLKSGTICSSSITSFNTASTTVYANPTAVAGTNINTCATSGAINITAGASATNQSMVNWTSSGTGTFTNQSSLTACTYTPSAADISSGTVTLTLTATGNAPCGTATSTKTITINQPITVTAGTNVSTCSTTGAVNITAGSSATNQTSVNWTSSGTGTFSNANSLTLCTYNPSAADKTLGIVTLTLTASGLSCPNVTSTKTLTIIPIPSITGTIPASRTLAGSVTLSATASAGTISWYSSSSGGSALGVGTSFTTPSLTATTTYYAEVVNGSCPSLTRTPVTASILYPEINIKGNGNSIADGSPTPSTNDWTDLGSINIGIGITKTYTIQNTGNGTLTLGAITITGADAAEFTVTTNPSATVSPGATTTFSVTFTPTTTGVKTASISIINDDSDENPYDFTLQGTGSESEIDILGNSTSIADGDTSPSIVDWTDFGLTNITIGNIVKTFTITNSGTSLLTIGTITLSGANASDFTVTALPSSTVVPGGSTTFTVRFIPSAAGIRTATILINNNDSNESPYDFSIQGTGGNQEIDIKGNTISIVDGSTTPSTTDWTDFSSVTMTRTFTIYNTGTSPLTIGAISFSGTNASDFSVTSAPNSIIIAGGSSTFTVTFNPSGTGTRTAIISIVNNDSNENPYDFSIQGIGSDQEIDIKGNATSIADGDTTPSTTDWTDFDTTATTRTFTIYNTGSTTLTLGAITFTGANASDFSIVTAPSSSITGYGSTTLVVRFTPGGTGTRIATMSIANTDSDENPYDFSLQGTGASQEIDITGNGTAIANGSNSPNLTDGTSFGGVAVSRTFTIYNTGTQDLTIGTISISGTNAGDFSITSPPANVVAGATSTTFTVTFTPTNPGGLKTATISIPNNDSNENPYTFAINATSQCEIDVTGLNVSIIDGDISPSQTDLTDFGSVSIESGSVNVTYTIKNTGSGTLALGAITISGANANDFTITTPPSSTVANGGSTSFTLAFKPTSLGPKNATISIPNNDTDENPYTFSVAGLGVRTYFDTDGDGVSDNFDLDDDNDGILDTVEQTSCSASPLATFVVHAFLNETFGVGTTKGLININIPGASTTSCYEDNITTNPNNCATNSSGVLDDGEYCVNYVITKTLSNDPENLHHDLAWTDQLDHTPSDVNGRMAIFNADNTAGTYFYQAIINGVVPNTPTSFSFWVMNIMRQGNLATSIKPNITIEFRDVTGATLITSYNTGDIGRCSASNPNDNTCGPSLSNWLQYSTTVNLGNITDFMIKIRNNAPGGGGNDFAMDDIIITQTYCDWDNDGVANLFDLDSDNDGISDIEEAGLKQFSNGLSKMDMSSSATWADANSNGMNDYIDPVFTGVVNSIPDIDGDGSGNVLDLDSDNDSLFDVDEAGLLNGDGDINGDGKGDGVDTDGDGILDIYDNSSTFGTSARPYALNTDGIGNPDYMQVDSNSDGINDISESLYSSLDTTLDGKIDGAADAEKDGILDTFDTNTTAIGSPRDLNRKLFLDFDGRNDYAENTSILGGLAQASLMAWIDLNNAFSTTGVIVGQDKFQLRITSGKKLEVVVNSASLTYNTVSLTTSQWYHVAAVFGGGTLKLYLNGNLVASQTVSGNIATDPTKLTLGRNPAGPNNYFKGKIDEVRVFNVALTDTQVQRMVYQEIQNNSSQVRGAIVPKDIGSLPFANVLRCYRMDAYKDDIVDDITTPSIDTGTGMKMYNHKNIYAQQAPMPFVTERTGTFATAVNSTTKDIRGMDIMDQDWSIVQVKHNITETANNIDLGMFVDSEVIIKMTNDTKIQNDWYLKLDGKIDLVGKSQLVQTINSDLDIASSGNIERDQQGQSNKYNYNYWSSPVSSVSNTSINHGFTVAGVMKDGTDPNNIKNIVWTTGYDGAATSPITLSNYWIYKFQNLTNDYANWTKVGENETVSSGQGYTLKGSDTGTPNQNYTFVGKPNNGNITVTVAANNLNLCGNPYPSALDAAKFINDNISSLATIDGTLLFWQHYSTNNTHILADYQGGYAALNITGGVAPVAPVGISGLGSSDSIPGRFIPVGASFFVTGSATGGTITFNNSQRFFEKENNAGSNPLFKSAPLTTSMDPKYNNREDSFTTESFAKIRLGFISTDNYHRQILLGFMNQYATSGIDKGYDALDEDELSNDMYFLNEDSELIIQGDGYFNIDNVYPLGIRNAVAGNVKIRLEGKENFDENQNIYIYDSVTDHYTNIVSQDYEVNLPEGSTDDRFSLRFTSPELRTNQNQFQNGISVYHSQSDHMINISNGMQDVAVKTVVLFNMLGQTITTWKIDDTSQSFIHLPVKNLSTGTYVVKVVSDKESISQKIIIK